MQRSLPNVERSCCRGTEPRVHAVPCSWGHEGQVTSDSGTPSLQKYPGLPRQCPLSFDHAQRNALREGKGRALQRRVPSGGGSCTFKRTGSKKESGSDLLKLT